MKLVLFLAVAACISSVAASAQTPADIVSLWDKEHVTKFVPSNMRHKDLLVYLDDLKKSGISVTQVGASYSGRSINQMQFGSGPMKVFLWSQMHGDEPTATSALVDMFALMQKHRSEEWVKNIERSMTIRAVPMLNPDGAEAYVRRNDQGLDINRDARDLRSPEANLLKRLRDEWSPDIGFNLHNQQSLTSAGPTPNQAAISFLVVYGDAAKTETPGLERNKRVVSMMVSALNGYIRGNIGKYDDSYTASAFGDNFSAWGTPVILVETGSLYGKDEMFLVKMNFLAFVAALRSLAEGTEKNMSPMNYDLLPKNSSGRLLNYIFRSVTIKERSPLATETGGDLGLATERRRAELTSPTYIRQAGQIFSASGLEEYLCKDFYVTGRYQPLRPGQPGELLFFKKDRTVDWSAPDLETISPPDAIFSLGRWVKGDGVVPRLR